jgi:hypothetical protein
MIRVLRVPGASTPEPVSTMVVNEDTVGQS